MVLSRLFKKAPPPRAAVIPAGQRVYAIGDIHGRADLFDQLLALIEADDAVRGSADTLIILLGDLVDRGPQSRQVIDQAIALHGERGAKLRWLVGNHEEVFLRALGGNPAAVRYFVRIGGEPTILSYDIDPDQYRDIDYEELAVLLPTLVPRAHATFLDAGEDRIVIGDYLFVHAGIRPGISVEGQQIEDLRWIRRDFLADRSDHGHVVVHGHSISDDPEDRGNRIGIDTGAYASGRLTALGLEGAERWYLST